MKFSKVKLIGSAAAVWMGIGTMLMIKGLRFLVEASLSERPFGLLDLTRKLAGGREQSALLLISVALFIGFFKGRIILARTVKRACARVASLSGEGGFADIFSRRDLIVIGFMMLLGMSMTLFKVPVDVRGFIDVAVGCALINGSLLYLRGLYVIRQNHL